MIVGVHYYSPFRLTHQARRARAYWDLGTRFGAFDRARGAWHAPLLDALLGDG